MKTITKEYVVYSYAELSEKAKEKAKNDFFNDYDYPFLYDNMKEKCEDLLKDAKIEGDPKLYFSLGYCQGDGAMFYGNFNWKGNEITISHQGHYYHYNSKEIIFENDDVKAETENIFNELYVSICKDLAKYGYEIMENETSEKSFEYLCEANEYNFLETGKMVNY